MATIGPGMFVFRCCLWSCVYSCLWRRLYKCCVSSGCMFFISKTSDVCFHIVIVGLISCVMFSLVQMKSTVLKSF